MRLKRQTSRSAAIDVTAFADIAFLMIIFFIMTTTVVKTAGQKLDIPSGTTDTTQEEQEQLTINIKGRDIYFGENNKRMSLDQLRATLAAEELHKREEDQRSVIVDSGPFVPYEHYFQVLMAVSRAGGVVALIDHETEAEK